MWVLNRYVCLAVVMFLAAGCNTWRPKSGSLLRGSKSDGIKTVQSSQDKKPVSSLQSTASTNSARNDSQSSAVKTSSGKSGSGGFLKSLAFWRTSDSPKKSAAAGKPALSKSASSSPVIASMKGADGASPAEGPDVKPVDSSDVEWALDPKHDPLLKPGLVVKITVMAAGKKEVEEPAKRVSASGLITLPLIGNVQVNGLTMEEFSVLLTKLYRDYLQDPIVDTEFVFEQGKDNISPWGYVTVLGRVKQPGRINILPTRDLSLSMAIQLAGGIDTSAKLTGIKITRTAAGKEPFQFEVDLQSVGAEGNVEKDVKLEPGDVVFVPETVF